jgi:hypothetical protein
LKGLRGSSKCHAYCAIAVLLLLLLLLLLYAGWLAPSSRERFATGLGAYWSFEDCVSAAQKAEVVTWLELLCRDFGWDWKAVGN